MELESSLQLIWFLTYSYLNFGISVVYYLSAEHSPPPGSGICIQWTGVLDWSAGMEYWNGITGVE